MSDLLFLMVRLTEILLGVNLVIQALEYLSLIDETGDQGVWSYSLQKNDLTPAPKWIIDLFGVLSQPKIYRIHLLIRLGLSIYLIVFGGSLPLIAFLTFSTLQTLIRWRGAFNGGSDFMTIVVLTGCLIGASGAVFGETELFWRAGLMYIAIHAASSYVISGGVKFLAPEWRSGRALSIFLDQSLHGPLAPNSPFRSAKIAFICAWAFILWEVSIALALLDPKLMILFCLAGFIFHFLVYWYFGLNRFFFTWISTFPALYFLSTQLL